jgi:hypothetical protein
MQKSKLDYLVLLAQNEKRWQGFQTTKPIWQDLLEP